MKSSVGETRDSFDYQWDRLKDSPWLLSNPRFRELCERILLDELGLSSRDILGKLVLDVGSGNGRWSYAFKKLGAEVVAYDYSLHGVRETKKTGVDVVLADALHPPFRQSIFDVVFAFGVLHHTGDLENSFEANAKLVKSRGIMHVYLYGPKGKRLKLWRFFIQSLPSFRLREATIVVFSKIRNKVHFFGRVIPFSNVHGGFDALSPRINVETDENHARTIFVKSGFCEISRIKTAWCDWRVDIHMQGVRK